MRVRLCLSSHSLLILFHPIPQPYQSQSLSFPFQVEIANYQARMAEEKAAWQKEQTATMEASLNEMRAVLKEELRLAATYTANAR